jgi:hypothetical protein
LNVLIWAKTGPTLAVGSYRGNLMIYNHKTAKRVPVIGKIAIIPQIPLRVQIANISQIPSRVPFLKKIP